MTEEQKNTRRRKTITGKNDKRIGKRMNDSAKAEWQQNTRNRAKAE